MHGSVGYAHRLKIGLSDGLSTTSPILKLSNARKDSRAYSLPLFANTAAIASLITRMFIYPFNQPNSTTLTYLSTSTAFNTSHANNYVVAHSRFNQNAAAVDGVFLAHATLQPYGYAICKPLLSIPAVYGGMYKIINTNAVAVNATTPGFNAIYVAPPVFIAMVGYKPAGIYNAYQFNDYTALTYKNYEDTKLYLVESTALLKCQ